jgi:hypothetical protein
MLDGNQQAGSLGHQVVVKAKHISLLLISSMRLTQDFSTHAPI